jgi:hypothetical protein
VSHNTEQLTRQQLADRLSASLPVWVSPSEAISGVILSTRKPEERTRAVEKSLNEAGVVYAWREEDASATKLAFDVLGHLGEAAVTGSHGIVKLGFALKELVSFLMDLGRHRVRLTDPLEISLLMMVRESAAGMTSDAMRQRFVDNHGADKAPTLTQIEDALAHLSKAHSAGGQKELVRADRQTWKCLV